MHVCGASSLTPHVRSDAPHKCNHYPTKGRPCSVGAAQNKASVKRLSSCFMLHPCCHCPLVRTLQPSQDCLRQSPPPTFRIPPSFCSASRWSTSRGPSRRCSARRPRITRLSVHRSCASALCSCTGEPSYFSSSSSFAAADSRSLMGSQSAYFKPLV